MSIRVLLDARKLGDGGIGVYLDSLIRSLVSHGLSEENPLELILLVPTNAQLAGSSFRQEILRGWQALCECIPDASGKYSPREYLLMGFQHSKLLKRVDLFHSPHYTLPYFLPVPAVVTVHDTIHLSAPDRRWKSLVAQMLISSALRRARAVITVSDESKRTLVEQFPSSTTPISVIHNSFPQQLEQKTPGEVSHFALRRRLTEGYLLFVGSDKYHKGFDILIEAFSILLNRTPSREKLQLIVVGKNFSRECHELVSYFGLESKVRFVGEVSASDLGLLYQGASALLLPSRCEGFGLCALEAMGLGVPVVSNPLPSVREILDDTGWFSEEFSPQAFALAIESVLDQPAEMLQKIRRGMTRVERFSSQVHAALTYGVYQSVLGITPSQAVIKEACSGELDCGESSGVQMGKRRA